MKKNQCVRPPEMRSVSHFKIDINTHALRIEYRNDKSIKIIIKVSFSYDEHLTSFNGLSKITTKKKKNNKCLNCDNSFLSKSNLPIILADT